MAFIASNLQTDKKEEPSKAPLSTSTVPGLNLTKEEVEVLLVLIKDMNFKGEHVEKIYNLVFKLQEYYMSLKH